jgi:hypothetical protein
LEYYSLEDFHLVVRLTSIEILEGSIVKAWYVIENRTAKVIGIVVLNPTEEAYAVDEAGRRYACEGVQGWPREFQPNVPVRVSLQFAALDPSARRLTLIFRAGNFFVGHPSVVFRNVALK